MRGKGKRHLGTQTASKVKHMSYDKGRNIQLETDRQSAGKINR